MRISDCSSDLCSSDLVGEHCVDRLLLIGGRRERKALDEIRIVGVVELDRQARLGGTAGLDLQQFGGNIMCLLARLALRLGPAVRAKAEIGRASCRERVWQYGEIPVVAGSLHKTQKIIKNLYE